MGSVIANSTIAWPDRWPPHLVGRWAPPEGRRAEGRTKLLGSFSRVRWGGSAIQLQVGNDHPSEVAPRDTSELGSRTRTRPPARAASSGLESSNPTVTDILRPRIDSTAARSSGG